MTSVLTAFSTRFRTHAGRSALLLAAGLGLAGCVGGAGAGAEGEGDGAADGPEVASVEAQLASGGRPGGAGYQCRNGQCTCDKSIENDCEDMSGVCRDQDIDDLIRCIDGWLTTHCVCTQLGRVAPKAPLQTALPLIGVKSLNGF